MATKKVTKVATKRAKKTVDTGPTYIWVISERSKLFSWNPIVAGVNFDEMTATRKSLEADSIYGNSGYKLTRVALRPTGAA